MRRADKVGLVLNEVRQPVNQVIIQSFIHSPIHLPTRSPCLFLCTVVFLYCVGNETVNKQKHGPYGTERKEVDVRQMIRNKVSAHMRKLVRFQECL